MHYEFFHVALYPTRTCREECDGNASRVELCCDTLCVVSCVPSVVTHFTALLYFFNLFDIKLLYPGDTVC